MKRRQLTDNYGTPLKLGQYVVVTPAAGIVCKGRIVEFYTSQARVFVRVEWPAGNTETIVCTKYGYRDGRIGMSEIIVLPDRVIDLHVYTV